MSRKLVYTVAVWQSGCDVSRVHSDSVPVSVYTVTVWQSDCAHSDSVAVLTVTVTVWQCDWRDLLCELVLEPTVPGHASYDACGLIDDILV